MTTKIQVRRDLAATWTSVNPTLSDGEIGFETDTNKFKIGANGVNWNALDYASGSITTGNTLITDSYGVTNVKYMSGGGIAADSYGIRVATADNYGIQHSSDGSIMAKLDYSTLTFDSYGATKVKLNQGFYVDNYGISVRLGSGLSFDSYGAIIATGGGSGGSISLADYSGLTLDSYGKLKIALGHAQGDSWTEGVYNPSGLYFDSYGGLALDLAKGAEGEYSGLYVGNYGLAIKTSANTWDTNDKSSGLTKDNYGLNVALDMQNGFYASGLTKNYYGLTIALTENGGGSWSGLQKTGYGLSVATGYDYSSGLYKDSYGLKIKTRDYWAGGSGLAFDSSYGIYVSTGEYTRPGYLGYSGLKLDSYGLMVNLKPTWAGGKGLSVDNYGLSVNIAPNSGIVDNGYGLEIHNPVNKTGFGKVATYAESGSIYYDGKDNVILMNLAYTPDGSPIDIDSFETTLTVRYQDGSSQNLTELYKIIGVKTPSNDIQWQFVNSITPSPQMLNISTIQLTPTADALQLFAYTGGAYYGYAIASTEVTSINYL